MTKIVAGGNGEVFPALSLKLKKISWFWEKISQLHLSIA